MHGNTNWSSQSYARVGIAVPRPFFDFSTSRLHIGTRQRTLGNHLPQKVRPAAGPHFLAKGRGASERAFLAGALPLSARALW